MRLLSVLSVKSLIIHRIEFFLVETAKSVHLSHEKYPLGDRFWVLETGSTAECNGTPI